jgi:CO/xanthine dehydrogenase Mo-binding subunit
VADAIGVRPHELPVTAEAIFEALRKRRRAEKLKAA